MVRGIGADVIGEVRGRVVEHKDQLRWAVSLSPTSIQFVHLPQHNVYYRPAPQ